MNRGKKEVAHKKAGRCKRNNLLGQTELPTKEKNYLKKERERKVVIIIAVSYY